MCALYHGSGYFYRHLHRPPCSQTAIQPNDLILHVGLPSHWSTICQNILEFLCNRFAICLTHITVKVPAPQEDVFHTISTVKAKALIHTTDRQRTVVVAVMGEEVEMQDLVEKAVYVLFLCFQLLPSDEEVVVLRNVRNDLFANLAADSWQSSEFVRHANMDESLDLGAGVDVDVVALDQVAVYLVAYFARQEKERRDLSVGQLTVSVS